MGKSTFAETLSRTTVSAREHKRQQDKNRSEARKEEKRRQNRRRDERIAHFVGENIETAVTDLEKAAEKASKKGKDHAEIEWRVERAPGDTKPTREIENYKGLGKAVCEIFNDREGISADRIEYRDSFTDRSGPSDEGYWPPTYTDHILGVYIEWATKKSDK